VAQFKASIVSRFSQQRHKIFQALPV